MGRSATVDVVIAVSRARLAAGPIEGVHGEAGLPDDPARSVTVALSRESLTAAARELVRHQACLSPLEPGSGLIVDSHVDAAMVYRHNARLALATEGGTSSFLRDRVASMADWEADLRKYLDEVADAKTRRQLSLPIRHTWQWRVYQGGMSPADHVNAEAEEILKFGRPVMAGERAIDFAVPEDELARRRERLRAFAAGEEPAC